MDYILKNCIAINVYFEQLRIPSVERRERMSIRELISSSGGQLGLCAGVSFITLAQAVWFLCMGFKSVALERSRRKFMLKNFLLDPNCQPSLKTAITIYTE